MPRDGWTPIGDTGWYQVGDVESAEFQKGMQAFFANAEALRAMLPDLLREHPGETVLVTDGGATVRFFPDRDALNAAVPFEERQHGVDELLVEPPEVMIV